MDLRTIAPIAALTIAAIAAVTDVRRGVIPNWLTLPPLAVAPLAYGLVAGPAAALGSLVAIAVCGFIPFLLFRRGAAGGGDVKLFAALGAIVGLSSGLEAQLLTLLAASSFSLGRLAWHGRLGRTLANSAFLALNPVLPARWRRDVDPELMTTVRLGGFAFVGTAIALLARPPWGPG